jgi:hypothetical protein
MDTREGLDNPHRRLFHEEPAPLAFISSVMTPDFASVREQVAEAVEQANNIVPWAFEMSPASSEDVIEGYLEKVRSAAFVILLVSESTSDPVINEVDEALAAGRRLLVFALPTEDRDERTQALLKRVKSSVRIRELANQDEIGDEVRVAVADEISRELSKRPGISKASRLAILWRESHARCIQKWQAAGLRSDLAIELSGSLEVGAPPANIVPSAPRPLSVLVGDGGYGKSLACERFLQAAITDARNVAGAPVPAFIAAPEGVGNLEGALIAATAGLGDPQLQGARVVIDGADETGDRSAGLLAEARELVRSWPDTQVMLSTRPMSAFAGIEEASQMPKLSENEARQVVGIAAGRDVSIGEHAGWPDPIKEAAEMPFFALLLGERLRRTGVLQGSRAELLAELADRSIGPQSAATRSRLRALAVLSVRRAGTRVSLSELGGPGTATELEASRLVVIKNGEAWFPLALAAQWLAAESLTDGVPSADELAANPRDLELWRFPLAMVAGSFSHAQATTVLGPLAERHPAFVSQVVDESIARWSKEKATAPPISEAGPRIRQAMAHWLPGLGELAELVVPGYDRETNQLPPLGVEQDGTHLAAGWYAGNEELNEVTRLPLELFFKGSETPDDRNWPRIRSVAPSRQAAWAWRWALEEISTRLEERLNGRDLPIEDTALEFPRLWLASVAVLGLAGSFAQPIPVDRVRQRATELLPQGDPNLRGYGPYAINLGRLIEILDQYAGEGIETIQPDRLEVEPSGRLHLTGGGRDEVQHGRITSVYQTALETYEELAGSLFAGLAPFMRIAATLPARLDGHLYSRRPRPSGPDGFEWSLFALPLGERSKAEITITNDGDPEVVEKWRKDWIASADAAERSLKALRPEQSRWISMGFQDFVWSGLGHLAMEEVVYGWLWSDLERIKLVSGRLEEYHYKTIP